MSGGGSLFVEHNLKTKNLKHGGVVEQEKAHGNQEYPRNEIQEFSRLDWTGLIKAGLE